MILTQIIEKKRKSVEAAKVVKPLEAIMGEAEKVSGISRFAKEISKEHRINLIAEIKKASPLRGILRKEFDPIKIASVYQMNGASALSILTEEKFFLGSIDHIVQVREKIDLPILRKDFIVDPYQIYESCLYRAEAILLIADILSKEELEDFLVLSNKLGLDAVVEVHNEEDLRKALETHAKIIGINNRDLHTFGVDLDVTTRLIKAIPKDRIVISESGIKTHEDIMFLKSIGVRAVLIGEAFMVAEDIGAKVKELMGS